MEIVVKRQVPRPTVVFLVLLATLAMFDTGEKHVGRSNSMRLFLTSSQVVAIPGRTGLGVL